MLEVKSCRNKMIYKTGITLQLICSSAPHNKYPAGVSNIICVTTYKVLKLKRIYSQLNNNNNTLLIHKLKYNYMHTTNLITEIPAKKEGPSSLARRRKR